MLNSETLFIVGAGASQEVGLPTGKALREKIAAMLQVTDSDPTMRAPRDKVILMALERHVRDSGPGQNDISYLSDACSYICSAMPQATSIDKFIDDRRDDANIELCGKLAISRAILQSESNSKLQFDDSNSYNSIDFGNISDTWFARLWEFLTRSCSRFEVDHIFDKVSFVVFNYDRCIEHFLFHSLQNYYGVPPDEAAICMSRLRIFHPYGVVGHLPWQNMESPVSFGGNCSAFQLLEIANQIKTYTEQMENQGTISDILRLIIRAETVVFLGFGFHEQNMDLLTTTAGKVAKRVFVTGKGISGSGRPIVKRQITKVLGSEYIDLKVFHENDYKCNALFDEYWRTLLVI